MISDDFRIISSNRDLLGESPVWDENRQCLLWADLIGKVIYSYDEATNKIDKWEFKEMIGSFGLCRSGRLIIGLASGIYLFDRDTGDLQYIVMPDGMPDQVTRFNDGKVSPDGRFYIGTMDYDWTGKASPPPSQEGKLYMIDENGKAHLMKTGFHISNGLAWTADGQFMYHACSVMGKIWYSPYSEGQEVLGQEAEYVSLDFADGVPDGAGVDVNDLYWSAGNSAACLNIFNLKGMLILKKRLPMMRPTMTCFGGKDYKTLYVTSLTEDMTDADFIRFPQSGGVIAYETEYSGLPTHLFNDDNL